MTVDMKRLPTLRLGSTGKAVSIAKQGINHWDARKHNTTPFYGPFFLPLVKQFQKAHAIPQSGVIGPATWADLMRHIPASGKALLPQKPLALVKPNQGFESLHKSLWEAYSIGRRAGLSDLGTYNPASRLPGGGPSDHSVYPAMAFDLGFSPQTGWANEQARRVALALAGRPEAEYVILGSKIWTDDGRGWHDYTAGNHEGHIHCSGHR